MRKIVHFLILILSLVVVVSACGGSEGLGAGGGQSLREGSTSPYHSDIAQDETYQTLLGLNILLYPAPVDDPKFDSYGKLHWDVDPTGFVSAMQENFDGTMSETAVYEPVVEELQDHPFVKEIQDLVYGGEPVQVGWVYGLNDSLDQLEYNGVTVTLVPANDSVIFLGAKDKLNTTDWTFASKDTQAFFVPDHVIVELLPDTLRSLPITANSQEGYLVAVITPAGVGLEDPAPGEGIDQALVSNNRWIFAFPDNPGGYFAGLTGSNTSIEPADSSPRYEK